MLATESDGKDNKVETSILLTCIGEQGRDIYHTFEFATAGDEFKFDRVIEKFDAYCNPRSSKTIARQQEGESFNTFVTDLKRLSNDCEFETLKSSLIVDMIIVGVNDKGLKERMLRETNLKIDDTIKLGQASEEAKKHLREMSSESRSSITHEVNKIDRSKYEKKEPSKLIRNCNFCKGDHLKRKCPAFGKICRKYSGKNHSEKACRTGD